MRDLEGQGIKSCMPVAMALKVINMYFFCAENISTVDDDWDVDY